MFAKGAASNAGSNPSCQEEVRRRVQRPHCRFFPGCSRYPQRSPHEHPVQHRLLHLLRSPHRSRLQVQRQMYPQSAWRQAATFRGDATSLFNGIDLIMGFLLKCEPTHRHSAAKAQLLRVPSPLSSDGRTALILRCSTESVHEYEILETFIFWKY